MTPEDVGFLKGVIVFLLLAGTGSGFYWLRVRAKALGTRDDSALDAIRDDQAHLRADLDARLAELEDRLDFTERRLVQGTQARLPHEPPAVSTPV